MSKIISFLHASFIGIFYIAYICYGLFGIYASFIGFEDAMGGFAAIIATILTLMGLTPVAIVGVFLWAYNVMDWGLFPSLLFTFPGIGFMFLSSIFFLISEIKNKILRGFGK